MISRIAPDAAAPDLPPEPSPAVMTVDLVAASSVGVWVIISPFILDARFSIAAPMYWSDIFSGGYLPGV